MPIMLLLLVVVMDEDFGGGACKQFALKAVMTLEVGPGSCCTLWGGDAYLFRFRWFGLPLPFSADYSCEEHDMLVSSSVLFEYIYNIYVT